MVAPAALVPAVHQNAFLPDDLRLQAALQEEALGVGELALLEAVGDEDGDGLSGGGDRVGRHGASLRCGGGRSPANCDRSGRSAAGTRRRDTQTRPWKKAADPTESVVARGR